MTIKPIRSDEDLREAFQRLELIFQAEEGTPEDESAKRSRLEMTAPTACFFWYTPAG